MIKYKVFKPFRIIKHLGKIGLLSLLCILNLSPAFAYAITIDATSFNPVPIVVQAKSGGVPVGTIAVWSKAELPEGWLECNGQSVSSNYSELRALMSSVPNYQGMFLRGTGSQRVGHGTYGSVTHQGGSLGSVQGDSIRNIEGKFGAPAASGSTEFHRPDNPGAFEVYGSSSYKMSSGGQWAQFGHKFDASNVVPTANENRPVNIAVKYIIKAE